MITREADYAIRVILYLSRRSEKDGIVSTAELSENMDIPYRFLRKIVRRMVDSGLVRSQRGKGGGVALAVAPAKISMLRVLRAVDRRSVILNACLDTGPPCTHKGHCPTHVELASLQEMLDERLESITFDQLAAS